LFVADSIPFYLRFCVSDFVRANLFVRAGLFWLAVTRPDVHYVDQDPAILFRFLATKLHQVSHAKVPWESVGKGMHAAAAAVAVENEHVERARRSRECCGVVSDGQHHCRNQKKEGKHIGPDVEVEKLHVVLIGSTKMK
jgi:hypothetical protein